MKIHQCTLISHKFERVELMIQCMFFKNLFCIAKLFSENCLPILLQSAVYKKSLFTHILAIIDYYLLGIFLKYPTIKGTKSKRLKKKMT